MADAIRQIGVSEVTFGGLKDNRSSHAQQSRHLHLRTSLSSNQSPFPRKSDFWPQRQARQRGSKSEVLSHRDLTPARTPQNAVCWRPSRKSLEVME
jgi:hypothetical protein